MFVGGEQCSALPPNLDLYQDAVDLSDAPTDVIFIVRRTHLVANDDTASVSIETR